MSLDDRAAVAAEVRRQLERFCQMLGRNPTHLDSHQHTHRQKPVYSIMQKLAQELRVPLRHYSSRVRYSGAFYGQSARGEPFPEGISVNGLMDILTNLPAGVTELGCHPGSADDLKSMYRAERAMEVRTLCDPRVHTFIAKEGIKLCSFHDVATS